MNYSGAQILLNGMGANCFTTDRELLRMFRRRYHNMYPTGLSRENRALRHRVTRQLLEVHHDNIKIYQYVTGGKCV